MTTQVHIPCRPNLSASETVQVRIQDALRRYAAERRTAASGFPVPEHNLRLAAGVESLAAHIGALDNEDPRLIALSVAGRVTSAPGEWEPGAEQRRVLGGIGRIQLGAERASAHDLNLITTELAAAATEDTYAVLTTKNTILEQERDRLKAEIAELRPRAQRTDDAELQRLEQANQHEVDLAAVMRKVRLDRLEPMPEPVSLEDPPEELPTGVRRHGRGFQAYRRGPDGRQRAKTFTTIAEAEAWRDNLTAEAAA